MIKEAYCSIEVARLLKERGFDIPCHCTYHPLFDYHHKKHNYNGKEYSGKNNEWISCPTHQMACVWLREIHHIHIDIIIEGNGCCIEYKAHVRPFKLIYPTRCFDSIDTIVVGKYKTFEEATEAALKYSLENLI